jgi:hypothetical protein
MDEVVTRAPPRPARRGGVVVRYMTDDLASPVESERVALGFIPAEVAKRLTALLALTPVPGAAPQVAGLALADGAVVTVLRVGRPPDDARIQPGADRAVLCALPAITTGSASGPLIDVALTGGVVLAVGLFDESADGAGVVWEDSAVPTIDVRGLYAAAMSAMSTP